MLKARVTDGGYGALPPELRPLSKFVNVERENGEECEVRVWPAGRISIALESGDEPLAEPEITQIEQAALHAIDNDDPTPKGESA